jgi:hypothetical protein
MPDYFLNVVFCGLVSSSGFPFNIYDVLHLAFDYAIHTISPKVVKCTALRRIKVSFILNVPFRFVFFHTFMRKMMVKQRGGG